MFNLIFFSSLNEDGNENHNDNSDNFGDKIQRKNRSNRISKNIQEIINPGILLSAMRELPSIQRPEKDLRQRPHAIFNNMDKSGSRHIEYARIFAAPVEIETNKKKKKTKNYCMSNDATISNTFRKKDSANELIDNIRQYCTKAHIPVSNTNFRSKISENEKYPDRNSNMS